jgi:hypothetical protein
MRLRNPIAVHWPSNYAQIETKYATEFEKEMQIKPQLIKKQSTITGCYSRIFQLLKWKKWDWDKVK